MAPVPPWLDGSRDALRRRFLIGAMATPAGFVVGTKASLDLPATWDLLVAFARTADDRGGVSAIFLDYELQG